VSFVQLQGVSVAFGARDVLNQVNFALNRGQKVALSGANGSGKTTLLKILAGVQLPDGGKRILPEKTSLAYLPQTGILLGTGSVYEEAERAFDRWAALEAEAETLLERVDTETSASTQKLLLRQHELHEALMASPYYQRRERISQTLTGLGFSDRDLARPAQSFSGGWQMRIALGRCLLEEPELLLLDEPTNYLDLEAIDWLEGFLKGSPCGFLLVSHDRSFLDAVVDEVVEVFQGSLTSYKGNYSTYETRRREELARLEEAQRIQAAEIERQEAYIDRFRSKATKASGVQSRIKALAKIDRIELPETLVPIHFQFPSAPHSGKQVLELTNLRKSYGTTPVLRGIDLTITRGEKIAVAGRNGAGKSTLMRILAGDDTQFEGQIRWGTDVQTASFSQDHERSLDPHKTVLEEVEADAPTSMIPRLRDLLGAFLFRGDDVQKRVSVLSGGEKNRLTLVKLLLRPANVLLLDEPTNHLDLASKDVLLEALEQFEGTVFVVSHDKYFLSKLAQKVLELRPEGHRLHWGGWADYHDAGLQRPALPQAAAPPLPEPSESQTDREQNKRRQSLVRRLEREEAALLDRLAELESQHGSLSEALSRPEIYSDGEKARSVQADLKANEEAQSDLQTLWETTAQELDDARK